MPRRKTPQEIDLGLFNLYDRGDSLFAAVPASPPSIETIAPFRQVASGTDGAIASPQGAAEPHPAVSSLSCSPVEQSRHEVPPLRVPDRLANTLSRRSRRDHLR